jgi:hypothetical protein
MSIGTTGEGGEDEIMTCPTRETVGSGTPRLTNQAGVAVLRSAAPLAPSVSISIVSVIVIVMSSSQRLQQIANHLSGNSTRGLLNGEVAIITGIFSV